MKLKIVHLNHEIQGGDEREQSMKEEQMEMEHSEEQQMDDESMRDDSLLLAPTPISAFPLLVSGKRKRKPKEIYDEVTPITRRKKKKSPASKSDNQGTPDIGGTLTSRGDATVGLSSPIPLKSPTVIRAEEFQSSLGNDQPTFMKVLVRSHVSSCFWMGLPGPFCKMHLPSEDTRVFLENENEEEFPIKYIAHKTGLSAGWRRFVAGNKLVEGDVLIYQLIEPCRFKVYIIRANDLTEVDGALSLLILDSHTKQNDAALKQLETTSPEGTIGVQSKKKKHRKSLPLTVVQKKNHSDSPLGPENRHREEHSGNDSDEVASEVLEGTKFSGSSFHFKDIKNFEEFHIVVNGVCIDSELPENTRRKYYDLCCTKNAFLHDRVLPGLCSKLAAGVIFETISITDAIRGCNITTPRNDFEVWEKSLRSFELLGLNTGFLRARLRRLLNLAFESEGALDIRRYWEAQKEQNSTEDEIKKLEAKIVELKELYAKYGHDIENLKTKAEDFELQFLDEVNAPW